MGSILFVSLGNPSVIMMITFRFPICKHTFLFECIVFIVLTIRINSLIDWCTVVAFCKKHYKMVHQKT